MIGLHSLKYMAAVYMIETVSCTCMYLARLKFIPGRRHETVRSLDSSPLIISDTCSRCMWHNYFSLILLRASHQVINFSITLYHQWSYNGHSLGVSSHTVAGVPCRFQPSPVIVGTVQEIPGDAAHPWPASTLALGKLGTDEVRPVNHQ